MSGISRRIRASRVLAGLSRAELGEAIDKSADTVRSIELGQRDPGKLEVPVIAETCQVPVEFLEFGWLAFTVKPQYAGQQPPTSPDESDGGEEPDPVALAAEIEGIDFDEESAGQG